MLILFCYALNLETDFAFMSQFQNNNRAVK